MQEDEEIPSHGALPDWDFSYAHMRKKSDDQAPISRPSMVHRPAFSFSPLISSPEEIANPSHGTRSSCIQLWMFIVVLQLIALDLHQNRFFHQSGQEKWTTPVFNSFSTKEFSPRSKFKT
ncbi:hypothetical protein L3Y34_011395 [Caenorhabditis briggsae]|nr:hypothetical protein L3Y34_011395 [Caenorhabditis briggsae]